MTSTHGLSPALNLPSNRATERQIEFIRALGAERGEDSDGWTFPDMTKAQASKMITELKSLPRVMTNLAPEHWTANLAPAAKLTAGVYRNDTGLYRVYPARSGPYMLAKLVVSEPGEPLEFEYQGAARRFVQPGDRLELESVAALGLEYDACMVCSRDLTDPDSRARGIGPICAEKY